ncbi:hypothetical protein GCM10010912_36770 [Paenibacillus albidus]|uniref:Uncharacterized protein n=1 Tax=Paenibacillus albidus TaxID=2041023 RepID=A0A917CGY5_9BACL|nr:hypothetical protein [Paenibacillus albidus]GGF88147.1 hypothetical protein GCM10010912_36770 [Paenibacillus albidus]
MKRRTSEEVLREVDFIQTMREKLMKAEKVKCPRCGEYLKFLGKNSGEHPGVFCPKGDFEILVEYD